MLKKEKDKKCKIIFFMKLQNLMTSLKIGPTTDMIKSL